ncbi:uncharacterized protein LOC119363346 [Triticum dicoccoides]|uniref:uncharacterized protein LOC119363346 n=1 Tax=Triticum dicoccoides TaxID=85692 RepID=UPI00188FA995|nr:uncharacterized protein LOC119363346 [Triticum dicoccoides]
MLQAVTGVLEPFMEVLLDGYCLGGGFEGVAMLVDVGGSSGAFLAMIISRVPTIRQGLNFDLPDVVAAAPPISGGEKGWQRRFTIYRTTNYMMQGRWGGRMKCRSDGEYLYRSKHRRRRLLVLPSHGRSKILAAAATSNLFIRERVRGRCHGRRLGCWWLLHHRSWLLCSRG